jgi:hypothetical protein
MDLTFRHPIAPLQSEPSLDCHEVILQPTRETCQLSDPAVGHVCHPRLQIAAPGAPGPWSEERGAFAWFMPGQHTALHRHFIAPEGRIFFAAEHISLTRTWIQGALESALQVVRDMLVANKR